MRTEKELKQKIKDMEFAMEHIYNEGTYRENEYFWCKTGIATLEWVMQDENK